MRYTSQEQLYSDNNCELIFNFPNYNKKKTKVNGSQTMKNYIPKAKTIITPSMFSHNHSYALSQANMHTQQH